MAVRMIDSLAGWVALVTGAVAVSVERSASA